MLIRDPFLLASMHLRLQWGFSSQWLYYSSLNPRFAGSVSWLHDWHARLIVTGYGFDACFLSFTSYFHHSQG
jgi:hypothetical protein